LRRDLHRCAELAHAESETADRLRDELRSVGDVEIVDGLGGHGLAAVIDTAASGPTVMLRADMDALPIAEGLEIDHRSATEGVAHKCGHDGHMAMAVGVVGKLVRKPPARGRAVVLFQPAEETGEGAAKVIADPAFKPLRPDLALAVHNLPGYDLGTVVIRPGPFACASRGLVAEFTGATSHAAQPERGRSPALAVAQLIESWSAARQFFTGLEESAHVTVIHAAVGRPAFGTSPGDGRVMATLRATGDAAVDRIEVQLRRLAAAAAEGWGLGLELRKAEVFPATTNDEEIVDVVINAANAHKLQVVDPGCPFPWSEDFGHFGRLCPAALVGLGAGRDTPDLHHPHYDFPDALLPIGVELIEASVRSLLDRRG